MPGVLDALPAFVVLWALLPDGQRPANRIEYLWGSPLERRVPMEQFLLDILVGVLVVLIVRHLFDE